MEDLPRHRRLPPAVAIEPRVCNIATLSTLCATQQTRDIDPMLILLLGQRRRRWLNIKSTLVKCLVFAGQGRNQQQKRCWSMLGQRLRRWTGIKPEMGQRIVFIGESYTLQRKYYQYQIYVPVNSFILTGLREKTIFEKSMLVEGRILIAGSLSRGAYKHMWRSLIVICYHKCYVSYNFERCISLNHFLIHFKNFKFLP